MSRVLFFFAFGVLARLGVAQHTHTSVVLSVEEISRLLPEKIMKGYNQTGSPSSRVMKVGTLTYSLVERKFTSGPSKIKIMLFDYLEAQIMYTQATAKFNSYTVVETDSLIMRHYELSGISGWGTETSRGPSAQITLGISNRYYLILEGEKTRIEDLEKVLEFIDILSFPK